MRIVLTVFALLFIISCSYAQEQPSGPPHLSLRTSLFAPLEADANVMLGVGVQWNERWAVIVDGGYIFAGPYAYSSSIEHEGDRVKGLKLRTELRYYFRELTYRGKTTFYIAPVFHYKKVSTERLDEFGMNCVNGDCDYFQLDTYKRIKQEYGGMITVGSFSPLFGGSRVAIETFIGLGIKVKKFRNTDFPFGATVFDPGESGWFSIDREGVFPMFPVGVRISLRLF